MKSSLVYLSVHEFLEINGLSPGPAVLGVERERERERERDE